MSSRILLPCGNLPAFLDADHARKSPSIVAGARRAVAAILVRPQPARSRALHKVSDVQDSDENSQDPLGRASSATVSNVRRLGCSENGSDMAPPDAMAM